MRNSKLALLAGLFSFALLGGVEVATSHNRPAAAASFDGGGTLGAAAPAQGDVGGAFGAGNKAPSAPVIGTSVGYGSSAGPTTGTSVGYGSSSPIMNPPVQPPSHCGCGSSFAAPTPPSWYAQPTVPTMPNASSFNRNR